ncbi:5-formyltetrahydrofolate cyclo-ligase [Marinobacter daqiaonensis]|uniref:5-formyltetrahydrofolate cyclo-ligase n=1 Tax=Marinobacter daqiaonensis TaxID=650891 RepID=A0A1I6I132_9GAMM|nr:5-formyltetrahydrofolate cyclo-ligase [Marinobacter daqiaonensis]SFR60397.1 5-formyltetrahydrofolate cyclo-ligase [Marinobacter daqiaonensis]
MNDAFQSLTSLAPDTADGRKAIRKDLRKQRRSLNTQQQRDAAIHLASMLRQHPRVMQARHLAVYLPNDGEIDPGLFMAQTRRRNVHFYLPVLHPIHDGQLAFCRFDEDTPMRPNRFGIAEPVFHSRRIRPAWAMDVVLMPLVGFDDQGGRLGMGGGFYDRTFAFTRLRPRLRPALIGLAHDLQRVRRLPIEDWDVPLDAVVTDRAIYRGRG